jgi:hypothetical protein
MWGNRSIGLKTLLKEKKLIQKEQKTKLNGLADVAERTKNFMPSE